MNTRPSSPFLNSRVSWMTALLLILGLGFSIRLYDLTDLPLDFHPTRQLMSALKARGMYYEILRDAPQEQREFAIQQWKTRASVEPAFIERIVAFTYRFTGEQLWVARLYSSLFWMIGAVFVFLLAREFASTEGALASTSLYLFLPYAIIASRSFQPDPFMVMLLIIFWWAVMKWSQNPQSYVYAVLAGLFGGFAIFIKFVAAFLVIGGGIGAVLSRATIREALRRPQVHMMIVLGVLPGAAYLIYGTWIAGFLGQQFGGRFIPAYFLNPSYYLGWIGVLNLVVGGGILMISLLGLYFFEKTGLRFLLGLWGGYFLLGLYFNYHIASHDYYSLPLIPIVAVSIAPLAGMILGRVSTSSLTRMTAGLIILFGVFATLWDTRTQMKSIDYRLQAGMWQEISERIGDQKAAGLTQDYGQRLAYWGWKNLTTWPSSGDLAYHSDLRGAQIDFEQKFNDLALTKEYFLVTDFSELARQPLLADQLKDYAVYAEGEGYVIYDLRITGSN